MKSDRRNVFGLLQSFISRINIEMGRVFFFNWAHAYELNGLQNGRRLSDIIMLP